VTICVASRRNSLDTTRHPRQVVRFCESVQALMNDSEEGDSRSTLTGRDLELGQEATSKLRQPSCRHQRQVVARHACATHLGSRRRPVESHPEVQ
jgi:hypothetical protein